MRYRKRPVVIEAVQITDATFDDPHPNPNHIVGVIYDPVHRVVRIPTLEGEMTGQIGDWIIRGVKGELYPCKPDIFEATYEAADPPLPLETEEDRTDIEVSWKFWETILMKDGHLDMGQLKKELCDWYYVMREVPKVYCAVTGDLLSKVMYPSDTVISAFEDYLTRQCEDAVSDAWTDLKELVKEQADDEALWSVPIAGTQPISEAYLQQELRKLHEAIEGGV